MNSFDLLTKKKNTNIPSLISTVYLLIPNSVIYLKKKKTSNKKLHNSFTN